MKTEMKIILGIFLMIGLTIFAFNKKNIINQKEEVSENYSITNRWELPKILEEVSGISWIGNEKIACIQDEDGSIFIYNLKTSNIEKQIDFANHGDYEDIVTYKNDAFVLRSDGIIFMIKDYLQDPKVTQHATFNDTERNVEGLALDEDHQRLLLAVKDEKNKDKNFKGVYAFDIDTKKFNFDPVYKIELKDEIFKNIHSKKTHKIMRPSAISFSSNKEKVLYLDGADPKLLVTDKKGKLSKLYKLNEDIFYQPEGITFSKNGRMFIANEGKKNKPNILEVVLN
ncbi:hypothetical protein SAMN04488096_10177 [Mesonia phycicola]|uniref:SdiA-regulated n=1 Tax=Mesonia phycicola TaxID=579105 RepID=A0A1M6A4Z5_9FLAO|nr:SdiA-regulated domain-containing protein [Mesonia phycicola]SHI31520.1 hypothetical protein SAMN04488096_10177 [Mesonia phycicola]